MAIVKMHQAKDGSLHKTAAQCAEHEVKIRLAPAIDKFLENIKMETPGLVNAAEVSLTEGVFFDLAALPGFLVANAEELRKLLNGALVTPKPRKPKDPSAAPKPRKKTADEAAKTDAKPEEPAPASTAGDSVDELLAGLG